MITVVFGVPGSGKTFYSVWWIKRRCLEEGDVFFRVRSDVLLITNLNLRLDLDTTEGYVYIQDWAEWKKYMDVDFWKANLSHIRGRKIVMVMDEAQVFFKLHGDDARVLFFLQYHRHLSVDILLITQSPRSLPQKIFELAEYLIEAVPRSVNPFSFASFRYRVLHPFDRSLVLRRFHLKYDPVIFFLYQDMIYKPSEEIEERPRNAFVSYYLLLAFFVLLTVLSIFLFFSRLSSPSLLSPSQSQAQPQAQAEPSGPVQPIDYEDLVVEVPEEKPKPKYEEKPNEGIRLPEQSGFFRIVVGGRADSPKYDEGEPLISGPKIIEIP
jgi:zona occludens toxin (predicted ATPase)